MTLSDPFLTRCSRRVRDLNTTLQAAGRGVRMFSQVSLVMMGTDEERGVTFWIVGVRKKKRGRRGVAGRGGTERAALAPFSRPND